MKREILLTLEELSIRFGTPEFAIPVVDTVGFDLARGETLALVGESGSGKTLTAKALMGLLPKGAHITSGSARIVTEKKAAGKKSKEENTVDLLQLPEPEMRRLRGTTVSMIFQEPMSALSPLHTVGRQVAEVLHASGSGRGVNARKRVLEIFKEVGFPDPARAWAAYPFELSGGLRQRAVIAMAMIGEPELVIADEPTTALDVTTQAMVLDLIRRLQRDHRMSMIMITHDLGVVANMADRVVVMRRGKVVEKGLAQDVLATPGHGYTKALIAAAPKVTDALRSHSAKQEDQILTIRQLSKTWPGRSRNFGPNDPPVRAVTDFDMTLGRGKTVAIVGESGSGKSTVAKLALRAERPDAGAEIRFRGKDGIECDVAALQGQALTDFRRKAQMVFQDPYASLSPRMSIQDILTEPLRIHGKGSGAERKERAAMLMSRVGLSPDHLARFPYAFSGGQRQRIAIARALALEPELVVCDEPTSALDVSVQAEVLDLLTELREEFGLSYVFISHDLAVVSKIADRVMVMRAGRIVEEGSAECVFGDPKHPYTKALMAASPEADTDRRLDLAAVAAGAGAPETWDAPFRFRADEAPALREVAPGHYVRSAA